MAKRKRILGHEPPRDPAIVNCPTCQGSGELLKGWRGSVRKGGGTPVFERCTMCRGEGRMRLVKVVE